MGLARTAQPSLRWAEISDLVRNIFPTCRKYVVCVYRQPRAKALEGYRYIEANPKTVSDLLVVDIDDANARAMALWEHEGMLPNVIVENPRNGHAHAVWALAAPFSSSLHRGGAPFYRIFCTLLDSPQALRQ